jgi:hypothetical protein
MARVHVSASSWSCSAARGGPWSGAAVDDLLLLLLLLKSVTLQPPKLPRPTDMALCICTARSRSRIHVGSVATQSSKSGKAMLNCRVGLSSYLQNRLKGVSHSQRILRTTSLRKAGRDLSRCHFRPTAHWHSGCDSTHARMLWNCPAATSSCVPHSSSRVVFVWGKVNSADSASAVVS